MEIEKIDRLNITIDSTDVKSITLSGGTYSSALTVEMIDGKIVEIKFSGGTTQLKSFLEHLNYAMDAMEWDMSYPGGYVRMGQSDVKTFEQIKEPLTKTPTDDPF